MSVTIVDRILGAVMVIAGLIFMAVAHPADGELTVAGIVTVGGVLTVVNAQALAAVAREIGLRPTSSAGSSPSSADSSAARQPTVSTSASSSVSHG